MSSEISFTSASPATPLREPGRILLVSCYELGQQPLGLAVPAGLLEAHGFSPDLLDLAVEPFDEAKAARAKLIGISVPMHTAIRLGVLAARRIRRLNPDCHICFYGLYASLNAEYLLKTAADSCLGAEFEYDLLALAQSGDRGETTRSGHRVLDATVLRRPRQPSLPIPSRDRLPPLERYVKLVDNGHRRHVGYVAASRGCKHRCLHCPITPVYGGRFYAIPKETVLRDIGQLVDDGAAHITFGDPDFLNGPAHALRIARLLRSAHPTVSFDYTAKIEHLLAHRDLVLELAELGCSFVVSAVESFNNTVLAHLEKGHTREDALAVIRYFRDSGLVLRPSFVPFTPWETLGSYLELLNIVEGEALIDHVDPIQYAIRLLVPPGSALLSRSAIHEFLGPLDEPGFSHRWIHPDPRMDGVHRMVVRIVEESAAEREDPAVTFFRIRKKAELGGALSPLDTESAAKRYPPDRPRPPRPTETWFC